MTEPLDETDAIDEDGPKCETCGKGDCPDADLPEFSEPRDCAYAPIYHALRDAKDCDYGCARDYTNQAVRLWVVEAVEQIVAARLAPVVRLLDQTDRVAREHQHLARLSTSEIRAALVQSPGVERGDRA